MMNERDNLSIQLCDAKCERDELMAANVTLAQENSRLRVALEFYSEKEHYSHVDPRGLFSLGISESKVEEDAGNIAREALGLIEA